VEIRESIKGVINIHNTNKLELQKENTLLYFSKYISLLHPELSKLMPVDFENIENFLSIGFNNKSQEKKIMELFKLYEFLPLNSQSKKTTQAIEKLYKIIEADRPFDPSQILLRQESFKQAIEEKTFVLAKVLYDKLLSTVPENFLCFMALRSCTTAKFGQQDFARVIKLFTIDIKALKQVVETQYGDLISSATPLIIEYIQKLWRTDKEKASSLLKYFIKQQLPFQSDQSYNHALIASFDDSKIINLDFIKALLESNVVNINTVITSKTDKTCKVVKTPFSVAIGKMNFELLELLLEHGADPYLAINEGRLVVEALYGEGVEFRMSSGLSKKLPMQEDQQKYIAKLDEFLENFFLSKLTKNQEALRKAPEELESKSNSSEASIPSTFDKEAVLFEGDDSSKKISAFDQYINYKAGAQNNKDLPAKKNLEHKFDFLLLNFIKSNDAQQLESLNTLVKENPELNGYFATCLVNSNISSDLVIETFADKYQLLNRFFTLKKALSFKEKIEPKVLKFQENVAEVYGNFANKIFVKIPEELLETLDVNYKTKLLAQLRDLHFIKSDSKGVSGIKSYTSSIKLKIAGFDQNLYTTERHLDQKV